MLAQATTFIPYPSTAVTRVLMDANHHWTVSLEDGGEALLARVGARVGSIPLYKQVRLQVGISEVAARRDSVMLPVSWAAVGGLPLFPKMLGTLHADPYGDQSTRLTLNAVYDPPLGAVGKLIDRAMMHRLAQSTMDDFIGRLAASLTDELRGKSAAS